MIMPIWMGIFLILMATGMLAGASVLAAVCLCAKRKFKSCPSDCIIVLGAKVWPDGRMSNSLRYRCETALQAWKQGIAPYIIVCGGKGLGEPEKEAAAMSAWLIENGMPENRILVEDASADTRENFLNARKIMGERGLKSAAVCTSDYHLTRALWLSKAMGIPACGIAAPSPATLRSFIFGRCREAVSWVLYFFRII